MEYATFTEDNEWEGETWRFYIPVEGNETALTELRALVDQTDESYHLNLVPIPERDVDARVAAPDDNGYMHGHNKLSGRLLVPSLDSLRATLGENWADEAFYKGGIKDWMVSDDA